MKVHMTLVADEHKNLQINRPKFYKIVITREVNLVARNWKTL